MEETVNVPSRETEVSKETKRLQTEKDILASEIGRLEDRLKIVLTEPLPEEEAKKEEELPTTQLGRSLREISRYLSIQTKRLRDIQQRLEI